MIQEKLLRARITIDKKVVVDEIACSGFVVLSDKDSGEIRHCYESIISKEK